MRTDKAFVQIRQALRWTSVTLMKVIEKPVLPALCRSESTV